MRWQNLKIGIKIGSGFALMMLIAILIGGAAFFTLNNIGSESASLSNDYIPFIGNSAQISQDWKEITGQVQMYDVAGDPYYIKRARARLVTFKAALQRLIEISANSESLKENKSSFEAIQNRITAFEANLGSYEKQVAGNLDQLNKLEVALASFRESTDGQTGRDAGITRVANGINEISSLVEQASRSEKPALLSGIEN